MSNGTFRAIQFHPEGVTESDAPISASKVQVGPEDAPKPGVRVNVGSKLSMNTFDGVIREHVPMEVNQGAQVGTDGLDNAKSPAGTPLARANVREDSIIEYKGLQVRGTELLRMGVLQKTATGSLEWAEGHAPQRGRSL